MSPLLHMLPRSPPPSGGTQAPCLVAPRSLRVATEASLFLKAIELWPASPLGHQLGLGPAHTQVPTHTPLGLQNVCASNTRYMCVAAVSCHPVQGLAHSGCLKK